MKDKTSTTIHNIRGYKTFRTSLGTWWAEFHLQIGVDSNQKPIMVYPGMHGRFRREAIRNAEKLVLSKYGDDYVFPEIPDHFDGGH